MHEVPAGTFFVSLQVVSLMRKEKITGLIFWRRKIC